jgi:hypothetical protein
MSKKLFLPLPLRDMLELGATPSRRSGNAPNNSANTRCGSHISQPHFVYVLSDFMLERQDT